MRDRQQLTYINIITDTLRRKTEVLGRLSAYTRKQSEILEADQPDWDLFEQQMNSKDDELKKLESLDDGFLDLYARVAETMKAEPEEYAKEISFIKSYIGMITDISTSLQAAEERNRLRLEVVLASGRKKVRDFKISSKTAAAYYKNMTGRHREGDSYFFDKGK